MPSVLAICDLRRRVRRHLAKGQVEVTDLAALLAVDPPAVLRGLRAASAPIYAGTTTRWTVARLVQSLGRAVSVRLTLTAERGTAGTTPTRRLWMRSVATACAARLLAEKNELMPPDEAYLLGLLHALPTWLDLLFRLRTGRTDATAAPKVWTDQWNLPPELAAACGVADQAGCDPKILAMLGSAQIIAELAGFTLDEHGVPDDDDDANILADQVAILLAHRTRVAVEQMLRRVGLDFTVPDGGSDDPDLTDDELAVLGGLSRGSFDELTLTLLSYRGTATYRGVITALTAAAIRHGGYDRACYARWCKGSGDLVIRAKADLSSRRLTQQHLAPNANEIEAMRLAIAEERPIRIELAPEDEPGILATLNVDEALLVPLNLGMQTPTFLVLDRCLSLEPIRLAADGDKAQTMSLAGTLLVENLLLRKRRDRAQKFASTDGLTHLFNRSMGMRILDQEIARAARSDHELAVLLCDLDHFKGLNDTLGHLLGDHALRVTAEVLRQTVRKSDAISRFGGEEFLVILPDTNVSDASVLAARLHTAIEERGQQLGLPLTISIGLALNQADDTWETILQRADQALYASKDRGRNRFATETNDIDSFGDAEPVAHNPAR